MVATAVKLASKRRRGIHVHSMLTVPTNLPLDAELPEAEAEAQSKIEQAKLIGGQRVTGHVERVRPGQAGYSIADEAKLINAAAVVVGAALPQRHAALRQDAADGARRAPLPGDRRLRPQRPAGRRSPPPAARPRIAVDGLARADLPRLGPRLLASSSSRSALVILVATLVAGGGPLSVGVLLGVAFVAVGAGRLWVSGAGWARPVSEPRAEAPGLAARAAAPPRARRPRALRRRLLGGRLLDLLRARRRRRPRPRPDAADLPRRRPALRPHHAQLRRGRGDDPRARRLLELRPPRLQRADRLHRRLGDPDRLPDRRRAGGDLGPALPEPISADFAEPGWEIGDRRRW